MVFINIFLTLTRRYTRRNSELLQNHTEKQIMLFRRKNTNKMAIFTDICCLFIVVALIEKLVFRQKVVTVYILSYLIIYVAS